MIGGIFDISEYTITGIEVKIPENKIEINYTCGCSSYSGFELDKLLLGRLKYNKLRSSHL